MIRLPDLALILPALPEPNEDFDLAKPRNPRNYAKRKLVANNSIAADINALVAGFHAK